MSQSGGLIQVINNFITEDEASRIIDFIENNLEVFESTQENKRYALKYGKDFLFQNSFEDFSKYNHLNHYFKDKIFPRVVDQIGKFYNKSDIAVSNLWFSKHCPGSVLRLHEDVDKGINPQFIYSGIIYLNSLEDTGILKFPFADFEYSPKVGDFIFFPSEGKTFAHEIDEINKTRYAIPMWISSKEYSL
jgi:2OG-Fe(II) oxygenase superfamily